MLQMSSEKQRKSVPVAGEDGDRYEGEWEERGGAGGRGRMMKTLAGFPEQLKTRARAKMLLAATDESRVGRRCARAASRRLFDIGQRLRVAVGLSAGVRGSVCQRRGVEDDCGYGSRSWGMMMVVVMMGGLRYRIEVD